MVDAVESTPQWSDTPSCSVHSDEVVTQEFMVAEQLERERIRLEEKKLAFEKSVEEYRNKKSRWHMHCVVLFFVLTIALRVFMWF